MCHIPNLLKSFDGCLFWCSTKERPYGFGTTFFFEWTSPLNSGDNFCMWGHKHLTSRVSLFCEGNRSTFVGCSFVWSVAVLFCMLMQVKHFTVSCLRWTCIKRVDVVRMFVKHSEWKSLHALSIDLKGNDFAKRDICIKCWTTALVSVVRSSWPDSEKH